MEGSDSGRNSRYVSAIEDAQNNLAETLRRLGSAQPEGLSRQKASVLAQEWENKKASPTKQKYRVKVNLGGSRSQNFAEITENNTPIANAQDELVKALLRSSRSREQKQVLDDLGGKLRRELDKAEKGKARVNFEQKQPQNEKGPRSISPGNVSTSSSEDLSEESKDGRSLAYSRSSNGVGSIGRVRRQGRQSRKSRKNMSVSSSGSHPKESKDARRFARSQNANRVARTRISDLQTSHSRPSLNRSKLSPLRPKTYSYEASKPKQKVVTVENFFPSSQAAVDRDYEDFATASWDNIPQITRPVPHLKKAEPICFQAPPIVKHKLTEPMHEPFNVFITQPHAERSYLQSRLRTAAHSERGGRSYSHRSHSHRGSEMCLNIHELEASHRLKTLSPQEFQSVERAPPTPQASAVHLNTSPTKRNRLRHLRGYQKNLSNAELLLELSRIGYEATVEGTIVFTPVGSAQGSRQTRKLLNSR